MRAIEIAPFPVTRIRLAPGESRGNTGWSFHTGAGQSRFVLMSYASEFGYRCSGVFFAWNHEATGHGIRWNRPTSMFFNWMPSFQQKPIRVLTVPSSWVGKSWYRGQQGRSRYHEETFTCTRVWWTFDGPFYFNGFVLWHEQNRLWNSIWTRTNMDISNQNYGGASVSYSWCAVFILMKFSVRLQGRKGFKDVVLVSAFWIGSVHYQIPKTSPIRWCRTCIIVIFWCTKRRWNDGTICCCAFHKCWICFSGSVYMNAYPNPLVNGSILIPVNKAFTTFPTFILKYYRSGRMGWKSWEKMVNTKPSMSDLPVHLFWKWSREINLPFPRLWSSK